MVAVYFYFELWLEQMYNFVGTARSGYLSCPRLHEAKYHVNVTLDMDELDITSAERKATYEAIKEYMLEKHGLQVTEI